MAFKTTFADPISIVKDSRVKMDESDRSFSDQSQNSTDEIFICEMTKRT